MNKESFFVPAWGGGQYSTKRKAGVRATAGYNYLLGTVPLPHVGLEFGNDNGAVGISGPIPGISVGSGLPKDYSGYNANFPRSLWKVIGDKMQGRTLEDSQDDASAQMLKNYIKSKGGKEDKHISTHDKSKKKNMNKEAVLRGFAKRANEHGFDVSKYLPNALMKNIPPEPMPTPPIGSGALGGAALGAGGGALAGPLAATALAGLVVPGAALGGGLGAAYGAYKESGKPKEERNYVRRMIGNGAVGAGLGVGLPILAGAGLGANMGSSMADADTARYQRELAERAERMQHPGVMDILKRMLPR